MSAKLLLHRKEGRTIGEKIMSGVARLGKCTAEFIILYLSSSRMIAKGSCIKDLDVSFVP